MKKSEGGAGGTHVQGFGNWDEGVCRYYMLRSILVTIAYADNFIGSSPEKGGYGSKTCNF